MTITKRSRWSLCRGKPPVPSRWLATAQLSTAWPVEADQNRVLRHVVLLSLAGGCRSLRHERDEPRRTRPRPGTPPRH